eukprot:CAMPEP_0119146364 /NCGR_PEP_ID=MMETSP1310-20130426/38807_1 /TAXON_ID=464262 /ORGANISM="Genus nov. species nov., Strain RCC2339" /LENGTH=162 /DNA_ID=CAMNT_0007138249 /DNA_START=157 /DNA_END=641 /DNA_ORIENTATION=+
MDSVSLRSNLCLRRFSRKQEDSAGGIRLDLLDDGDVAEGDVLDMIWSLIPPVKEAEEFLQNETTTVLDAEDYLENYRGDVFFLYKQYCQLMAAASAQISTGGPEHHPGGPVSEEKRTVFGLREQDHRLLERYFTSKGNVVVIGTTGVGKSSLINAYFTHGVR